MPPATASRCRLKPPWRRSTEMLIKLRKGKRAQSLVIVALSATALFGIIALGLDAGRLYFQRRDVQNAADAGALAGAQELLPPDGNPGRTNAMIAKPNCQAP